jgi:ketosteroid isomerase-like protein
VQVAGQQAVNLLTVNGDNVDGQLAALTGNSTGDFQRQFEGITKTFGDVVRQGKVNSTGRVEAAGVDQLNGDTARVQLALSSTVTNSQASDPQTRQYRITVDLQRKEDRWLVAGMQFVP